MPCDDQGAMSSVSMATMRSIYVEHPCGALHEIDLANTVPGGEPDRPHGQRHTRARRQPAPAARAASAAFYRANRAPTGTNVRFVRPGDIFPSPLTGRTTAPLQRLRNRLLCLFGRGGGL